MKMEVLFAGVRVREIAPAAEWYARLFGRVADMVPNDDEVMWHVTDGAWLYVIRDAVRAGNSLVTICVTDLDAAVAELAGRDIAVGPIAPVGEAGRKATGEDPDGNSVDLIEVPR
jgi:predicted enzyme related to lactoylglutathione lyase